MAIQISSGPALETPEASATARGVFRSILTRISPLFIPVAAVTLWQLLTFVVPEVALASPLDTLEAAVAGIREGWFSRHLSVTLEELALAFALAVIVGLAFALVIGTSRFWTSVFEPILLWIYSIPKITIFPVFLLVLGLSLEARVAFGAFHGFFPLVIITLAGVRGIPDVYLRTARSLRLGRVEIARRVIFPAVLPSIMAGLRFCFNVCFLGVVLAEMFGSQAGAGYLLMNFMELQQMPQMYAVALLMIVGAMTMNLGLVKLEDWVRSKQS